MKLSVIIPIYNVKNYLEKCIESVLNQDYKNFELILVDDGSTDGSSLICDKYSCNSPNVFVYHQANSGVCAARNLGIEKATGDYLCFVDGDDYLEPGYFSKANFILESTLPKLLVNTYKIKQNDNDCYLCHSTKSQSIFNKKQYIKQLLLGKLFGFGPVAKFYHHSLAKNIRFDNRYRYCEDLLFNYEFYNKLNDDDLIVYAPLTYYVYYQRQSSACHSFNVKQRLDEISVYEYIMQTANKQVARKVFGNHYVRKLLLLKALAQKESSDCNTECIKLLDKKIKAVLPRAILNLNISLRKKIKLVKIAFMQSKKG